MASRFDLADRDRLRAMLDRMGITLMTVTANGYLISRRQYDELPSTVHSELSRHDAASRIEMAENNGHIEFTPGPQISEEIPQWFHTGTTVHTLIDNPRRTARSTPKVNGFTYNPQRIHL